MLLASGSLLLRFMLFLGGEPDTKHKHIMSLDKLLNSFPEIWSNLGNAEIYLPEWSAILWLLRMSPATLVGSVMGLNALCVALGYPPPGKSSLASFLMQHYDQTWLKHRKQEREPITLDDLTMLLDWAPFGVNRQVWMEYIALSFVFAHRHSEVRFLDPRDLILPPTWGDYAIWGCYIKNPKVGTFNHAMVPVPTIPPECLDLVRGFAARKEFGGFR